MDFLLMLPVFIVIGGLGWLLIWQPIKAEKQASREAEEKERQMLANMTAEEQAAYWKGKYEREKAMDNNNWVEHHFDNPILDPEYSGLPGNIFTDDD